MGAVVPRQISQIFFCNGSKYGQKYYLAKYPQAKPALILKLNYLSLKREKTMAESNISVRIEGFKVPPSKSGKCKKVAAMCEQIDQA